jgi:hypothetical protein
MQRDIDIPPPPNLSELYQAGYRVTHHTGPAINIYEANSPHGNLLYWGVVRDDAWSACLSHRNQNADQQQGND